MLWARVYSFPFQVMKKEIEVRMPRVPTNHGELGLNYKRGDKGLAV